MFVLLSFCAWNTAKADNPIPFIVAGTNQGNTAYVTSFYSDLRLGNGEYRDLVKVTRLRNVDSDKVEAQTYYIQTDKEGNIQEVFVSTSVLEGQIEGIYFSFNNDGKTLSESGILRISNNDARKETVHTVADWIHQIGEAGSIRVFLQESFTPVYDSDSPNRLANLYSYLNPEAVNVKSVVKRIGLIDDYLRDAMVVPYSVEPTRDKQVTRLGEIKNEPWKARQAPSLASSTNQKQILDRAGEEFRSGEGLSPQDPGKKRRR